MIIVIIDNTSTYHIKIFETNVGPFSQNLSALGYDWIRLRNVLYMNVRFRKNPNLFWFLATIPESTFFNYLHTISNIEWQSKFHIAMPIVDRLKGKLRFFIKNAVYLDETIILKLWNKLNKSSEYICSFFVRYPYHLIMSVFT